jgi:hypothetical protein
LVVTWDEECLFRNIASFSRPRIRSRISWVLDVYDDGTEELA